MFDFDASKLLIVGVIALIFIPPKDLPRVLRQVGQFVGKMRRMAAEFQGQFMDAMREADVADMRKEAQKLADAARIETGLESIHDYNRTMMKSFDSKDAAPPAPAGPDPAFAALQSELRPLVETSAPEQGREGRGTELVQEGHPPHAKDVPPAA